MIIKIKKKDEIVFNCECSYFSLLNTKIVLWYNTSILTYEINKDTSVYVNWKLKKTFRDKYINQYNLKWKLIKTWESINEISLTLWIHCSSICASCKWKAYTANWFIWTYKWDEKVLLNALEKAKERQVLKWRTEEEKKAIYKEYQKNYYYNVLKNVRSII